MKLNREQITQALEFCSNCECNNDKTQAECPLINMPFCKNYLRKQSLALIKELTEENEDLRVPTYILRADGGVELMPTIKSIKADAVRKMQEKIRAKSEYGTINMSPWQLDQIAKEMLED